MATTSALAITIAGSNPNTLNVTYNQVLNGVNLSGVAQIITGGAGCSGALLSDGLSILTAGHCVTSAYGNQLYGSSTVSFLGPSGLVSESVSGVVVNSGWTGDATQGGDLAIIHLTDAAPSFATRYDLFTGVPTTAIDVVAGYGYGGTGSAGYDSSTYPFGTLRAGTNRYVTTGTYIGWSNTLLLGQLYDSSNAQTNALNSPTPYSASNEVDIAPGDSGGPTFQGGQLVGVHDLIVCFTGTSGCANPPSPLSANNSSYGQIFADTSVSANYNWIISNEVSTVPEPGTTALLVGGLGMIALYRRRRG